jgi:hypothetical protein
MPQEYWHLPLTGDVMPSLKVFKEHIRSFAFCSGFDVVLEGGASSQYPGLRLCCIHHGDAIRNNRGLEDRVIKDETGKIMSKRKVEITLVTQLSCTRKVRCSWKDIHRDRGDKAWLVKVLSSSHSHELRDDLLTYWVILRSLMSIDNKPRLHKSIV